MSGDGEQFEQRLRSAETELIRVDARINTHERECSLRYMAINGRLKELRTWIIVAILAAAGGGPVVDKLLGLVL